MKASTLLGMLLLVSALSTHAADTLTIPQADLGTYWALAPELMGPVLPPAARGTHAVLERVGTVTITFSMTIDADGVPQDFELIAIKPEGVESRGFVANELFRRYKPATTNPGRQPVRVTITQDNYIP